MSRGQIAYLAQATRVSRALSVTPAIDDSDTIRAAKLGKEQGSEIAETGGTELLRLAKPPRIEAHDSSPGKVEASAALVMRLRFP